MQLAGRRNTHPSRPPPCSVNLDDGIVNVDRGADGNLVPTPAMGDWKNISDVLHSMGFLFGVYTDRGPKTCGGRASAQGFEKQDAAFYAANGVDYVKEDSAFDAARQYLPVEYTKSASKNPHPSILPNATGCNAPQDHPTAFAQYAAMRDGIDATGRDMFFSLCGWNAWYSPVMRALANSARIGPDDTNWNGVLTDIDDMLNLFENGGAGGWNDPCLLLGNDMHGSPAQTEQQSRFQFTAWALLAAPMLLSQDVINITPFRLETYLNEEVIAVGQDPMGRQGILLAGGALGIAPRSLAHHLARRNGGAIPDPRTVLSADELKRLRGSQWHGDGNTPLTLATCAAPTSTLQKWAWNVSGTNYLSNAATQLCANTDDCGSPLIAFTCINTGSTCCGNGCFDNMRFTLGSDGTLRTPSQPGQCVASSGAGMQVGLEACVPGGAAKQTWAWDAATGQLSSGGLCLTVGDGSKPRSAVLGRPLIDGSWAVGFFNAGLGAADITCDQTCIAGMGFEATQSFHLRDLYAHAELPDVQAGMNITVPALQADGGVALFQLTPFFNAKLPPPPA